jgi:hypothetical protein
VTVRTASFSGTQNGLRIKTWGTPTNSFVRGVTFEHVTMDNVQNPIIINQNYCAGGEGCTGQVCNCTSFSVPTKIVVQWDYIFQTPCVRLRSSSCRECAKYDRWFRLLHHGFHYLILDLLFCSLHTYKLAMLPIMTSTEHQQHKLQWNLNVVPRNRAMG